MGRTSNQIAVTIGEKRNQNSFCQIDTEVLQKAMNELKGESFKLWIYLAKNKTGYKVILNQKLCESWGIKKDSYYKAREVLEELGYLVEVGAGEYRFEEQSKGPVEVQKNEVKILVDVLDF